MTCYRVTLAYDGTDFAGWQVQPASTAERTVQGVLETALAQLAAGCVRSVGAGRTDAGVHALGQVASFELARVWPPRDLQRALNALLPADVRVLAAAVVAPGWNARHEARSKLYRYVLDTGPVQLPTRRRYAAHVPQHVDPELIREAADLFLGRHDFAALASSGGSVKTTERTVTRSAARFEGEALVYEVEADGFLRKMVRSIVGGLIAAGLGRCSVAELRIALRSRDRRLWPPPAQARGLTLVSVDYAAEPNVPPAPGPAPGLR